MNLNNASTNSKTNIGVLCIILSMPWGETGKIFWQLLKTWDLNKLLQLIFLFFLFFSFAIYDREVDKVIKGDTIESIAQRNFPRVWSSNGKGLKSYVEDIKKWNPKITDWNKPPVNQLIYVTYPYDPYASGSTWAPPLPMNMESNDINRGLSVTVFYATSFGSYSEVTTNQNVNSDQNFPVTIGFSGSMSDEAKVHFLVGSFYWAQPSKGSVIGNSESLTGEFSIPGEIGGNLYYQNYNSVYGLGLYTGYDYESLNTFNTAEIVGGDAIKNVNNQMHYGTIGVVSNFDLFKMKFNIRTSFSKVVASSNDAGKNFTGSKYILALTYKPESRFSIGAFYKHHDLKGNTKLSIDRIGFNLGFIVF